MDIKNIKDLEIALSSFDYSLENNSKFLGTGSEQVVIRNNNKIIHFIGLGYSKIKENEVEIAISEMRAYFSKLKKAGVKTSNPNFDNILIFSKPFPLIIIEDQFAGKPVQDFMDKSDEKYLNIFEKLLEETLKAVNNKVPMDSSAKNYVLNDKNEVIYVDFFVPYTAKWLFHKNKSEEFKLFTLLNFFIPNCELFIFVSKSIIKHPDLKSKILQILYPKLKGELLIKLKNKFESEEFDFLLNNFKRLMDEHKEPLSDEEIFLKIGYFDKTKKLLMDKSEVIDSSLLIKDLYKKMNKANYIARPYNCLLWAKEDIDNAINLMTKIKSQAP